VDCGQERKRRSKRCDSAELVGVDALWRKAHCSRLQGMTSQSQNVEMCNVHEHGAGAGAGILHRTVRAPPVQVSFAKYRYNQRLSELLW
jgi:hypothetical protein